MVNSSLGKHVCFICCIHIKMSILIALWCVYIGCIIQLKRLCGLFVNIQFISRFNLIRKRYVHITPDNVKSIYLYISVMACVPSALYITFHCNITY